MVNNQIAEGNITELDYQMNTIEQILFNEKERVLNAKTPLFEATEVIYEAIDKRINELVDKTKYNCKFVILLGAILINSDSDMGSFTEVRRFDVIDLITKTRQNNIDRFDSL